uniref:Bm10231, isoform f n=1 Tax=Brugia malayi TaxID=6279 RepID=A0A0J9XX75_BRUMA|nr:Bm10231, isoform f [Brugia malayi]
MFATASSTGGADDYDKLFTQTSIDLSNKHLEKLPNLRQSYPKVEINVSFNALERFSSFLPLADALKRLDISHNALSNCDNLAALTQLVWLDAAYNHIQVLPLLDRLAHLTYLNVSSNRLSVLPNLSKLPVLKILILNDNGISTLDDLHRTMPQCLQDLDIGANVITDLREAQHLSCLKNIRSLVFAGNPCVRLEGRTFCYRPYLYCCCLEQLQIVDGKELSETEIIKGEELHTHAKIRRMETHAQLCAYLEKECPEDCHHTFSPDDNRLMKILKKRREHASRLKDDMTSEESTVTAISPYREWLSKSVSSIPSRLEYNSYTTQQKENCVPLVDLNNLSSLSARISTPPTSANSNASSSTVTLSAPSVSSSTPVRSRIQRRLQSKPVQVRKISFTTNNTPKKSNTVDHSNWSAKHQKSLMRNIVKAPPNWPKAFGVSKSVTQNPRYRFSSTENSIEISFVSARKVRNYSEKEKKAALLIQSWWRGMKIRRLYRVPFLQKRIQRFETLLREKSNMILKLKNQLANLEYNIETIVAVNEEQAMKIAKMEQCLAKISETCNERQKQFMNKLLPVPDELQYIRKSDTEVLLQWQNHQRPQKPTRYLITVNGNPCGTVRGLHKKVLVTDLDPTKESVIRMQCVFNEFSGDISECLVIPSHKQETSCINEDDLDVKYGVMNQNDSESADKKKRKKSKGRALEIDFPLHSSGLMQWIDEPFHLSNSDTALSPAVSSLSNVNNSNQLLTLMKGALNSTSDASIAKPLSSITNDFTKLPQRYLNGTGTMGTELNSIINSHQKIIGSTVVHKRLSAQNGDIFYDQNTELVDQRMFLQDARFHLERRFIEQRLKDVEKRYEERLSNASLMLKKAYKEILDLRLGKAKALANKRMGQAELALKHANAIHSRSIIFLNFCRTIQP